MVFMKTKIFLILMAILCVAGLQSCDNDENPSLPAELQNAFSERYPSAARVEWEVKSGYYVADFYDGANEASAWFSSDGAWYMTETDILYPDLPDAVKSAFETGDYSGWTVEDIDKLEREGMETVYVIEVEMHSQGREQEMDLYYSADGILIKAIADIDNEDDEYFPPSQITDAILAFVHEKYPNARLVETDVEYGITEVEIIHEERTKEVRFDNQGNWISTSWDILRSEVPAVITEALASSQYSTYTIDDVEYFETPQGDYYELELEQGTKEIKVKIDTAGQFV